MLVGGLLEPLALLENRSKTTCHWLQICLVGTTCERDAIGAEVELRLGNSVLHHFVVTGDGYMGKNQRLVFAGLGNHDTVDSLIVHWPGGTQQRCDNVRSDQRVVVVEGQEGWYSFNPQD